MAPAKKKSNSKAAAKSKTKPLKTMKCYKEGIHTRNPFLNFLRKYRKEHCGLSIIDIAKRGGEEWRKMSECEKCPFIMEAFHTPRRVRSSSKSRSVRTRKVVKMRVKQRSRSIARGGYVKTVKRRRMSKRMTKTQTSRGSRVKKDSQNKLIKKEPE